ncbi:MAG: MFS transporter [Reichenbachiella sp.]
MSNKPTKKRYGVLTLIFISVVINYMDRVNISVAATGMTKDLGLSNIQMGYIFSAFGISYSLAQIPGGFIADFVKPRILYPVILTLWSVATALQGFANSLMTLIGFRVSIGLFEAPSYPTNNKIVTSWFPESERASAIGIYTSGQFLGLALLSPVLFTIMEFAGWRGLFYFSGILGVLWAIIWYFFYRDPQDHKSINQEELDLIEDGGGVIDKTDKKEVKKLSKKEYLVAFTSVKLWGIYLGQFCMGGVTIFFLTWFPKYLVDYRGLDMLESGFLASIPFIGGFLGVVTAGFASDYFVRIGKSVEFSRKAPILFGLLLSTSIIGANFVDSTSLVILFLTVAFFGNGLASIAWVFVSILAPKKTIGFVGGVFNFVGGSSYWVIPAVIGYLAKDGDFAPALFFAGILALIGFLSYVLIVGKLERIKTPE